MTISLIHELDFICTVKVGACGLCRQEGLLLSRLHSCLGLSLSSNGIPAILKPTIVLRSHFDPAILLILIRKGSERVIVDRESVINEAALDVTAAAGSGIQAEVRRKGGRILLPTGPVTQFIRQEVCRRIDRN